MLTTHQSYKLYITVKNSDITDLNKLTSVRSVHLCKDIFTNWVLLFYLHLHFDMGAGSKDQCGCQFMFSDVQILFIIQLERFNILQTHTHTQHHVVNTY